MANDSIKELFDAIVNDDLVSFAKLTEGKSGLSYSFGRFPILSLCYLYRSKKIIKNYEKRLLAITDYSIQNKEFDAYSEFRKAAGKSLRLYVDSESLVTPLEMLLILNERYQLNYAYPLAGITPEIKERLKRIERINYYGKPRDTNGRLIFAPRPISDKQKLFSLIVLILTAITLILGVFSAVYTSSFGNGTESKPLRLSDENQIKQAIIEGVKNIELTEDITVVATLGALSGTIEGNGHTLYYKPNELQPLFIEIGKGAKVENLRIVVQGYDEEGLQVTESVGIIATKNSGTMKNIDVVVEASFEVLNTALTDDANKTLYFSCMAAINQGTITDCNLNTKLKVNGYREINTVFGGIAAKNDVITDENGVQTGNIIENCTVKEGSVIELITVDGGALLGTNSLYCTVRGCSNYASVTQSTSAATWSTYVSGVVFSNYGLLENCANYGSVTGKHEASEQGTDSEGKPYVGVVSVGGIVSVNYGNVIKSKNTGELKAESKLAYLYLGGICAHQIYQSTQNSKTDNCYNAGKLILVCESESAFGFSGEILGRFFGDEESLIPFFYSYVINCFGYGGSSIAKNSVNLFYGGIVGLASYQPIYFGLMSLSNNYFVKNQESLQSIAHYLQENSLYAGSDYGATALTKTEELKTLAIYWE